MSAGLHIDFLPRYHISSFRRFEENEKHVSRVFHEDVMILVYDGILRFTENGVPIEVKKNQYYIQRAGLEQKGTEPSDLPKYFYIHFRGDFGESENGIPIRGDYDPALLLPLFRRLESLERDITSGLFKKTCIFYRILSILNLQNVRRSQKQILAEKLLDELVENYSGGITVGMLAEKYHYSKNYVTRIFYDKFGVSPYRYLLRFRLQKSHQLLANSTKPIRQICEECGFHDYSVFYKHFVGRYHMAPSEFRRMSRI